MTEGPVADHSSRDLLILWLVLYIVFLSWEVTVRSWDLYRTVPSVDLVGHFLAGMAVTAFFFWILRRRVARRRADPGTSTRSDATLAVLLSGGVALAWEALEIVQELVVPDLPYLQDYFVWDGVFDVVLALLGSVLFFPLLRVLAQSTSYFRQV